jgi:phosphoenolpyruvate carboxykinase (GTP)
VALSQCPTVTYTLEDRLGVPISAIVFGGRRARVAPLVYEARNWRHGVYIGATMVSETTPAAVGDVGVPRNDPMAMLPFCGYNMADYFRHWLSIGERLRHPPKIFHVNWFRMAPEGKYLWPGFGDNIRVLDWILKRVDGAASARATPIGSVPSAGALDLSGLDMTPDRLERLLAVDPSEWLREAERNGIFLNRFGSRLPRTLANEHRALVERLEKMRS